MHVCAHYNVGNFSSGDPDTFSHREFSFTLADDVYVRYQSFDNREALEEGVRKATPYKMDIGAIFSVKVGIHVHYSVTLLKVSMSLLVVFWLRLSVFSFPFTFSQV